MLLRQALKSLGRWKHPHRETERFMALAIVSLLYSWVFFSCLPEECHWNKEQVQYLSSSLYPTYFLRAVFLIPPEPDFVNKHQFFFSMVQVSGELCLYHLTAAVQGQGSGWEYKGVVPGAEESSRKALLHCDRQQETGAWEQRSFKMWTYFPWFLCLSFHSKPTSTSSQNPPPFPFPPVCWHSLLAAGCPDFTLLLLFSCKQMFFRWWHLSEFGRRCAGCQEGSVVSRPGAELLLSPCHQAQQVALAVLTRHLCSSGVGHWGTVTCHIERHLQSWPWGRQMGHCCAVRCCGTPHPTRISCGTVRSEQRIISLSRSALYCFR